MVAVALLILVNPVNADIEVVSQTQTENRIDTDQKYILPNKPEVKINRWQLNGRVEAGGAYIHSNDQLMTEGENEISSSIDQKADAFPSDLYAVLVDFTLSNQHAQTEFYLRTPIDADLAITIGAAKEFEATGQWDLSLFVKLDDTVWKNPYLQNIAREETDVENSGLSLQHGDFVYSMNRLDVKDDVIGDDIPQLQRDGYIHSISFIPTIPLSEISVLKPKLTYAKDELEGKSQSADNLELEVAYETKHQAFLFHGELAMGLSRYKEANPLFDEKRDSLNYSTTIIVTLLDPMGLRGVFNNIVADYSCVDSKIEFFDSCTSIIGATVGYRF